jgi:hypothetical protein
MIAGEGRADGFSRASVIEDAVMQNARSIVFPFWSTEVADPVP